MKFIAKNKLTEVQNLDAVVALVFEKEEFGKDLLYFDEVSGGRVKNISDKGEITGKYDEITVVHTLSKRAERIVVIGAGSRADFNRRKLRSLMAQAAKTCQKIRVSKVGVIDSGHSAVTDQAFAECVAEGFVMGLYNFSKYLSEKPEELYITEVYVANSAKKFQNWISEAAVVAQNVNIARDLVNEPANTITPQNFAEYAEKACAKLPVKCTVYDEKKLEKMGMEAYLTVARASAKPARMIVVEYSGGKKNEKPLYLLGKGLTFDSGGYSLKPHDAMKNMKCDMAGAAVVLAAIKAIAENKMPVNIVAICAMCENMISGDGYRVSDVIGTRAGKTVEVHSTDAEGRLVLGDVLSYIVEQKNSGIIDVATLTGGVITALGYGITGMMGTSQDMMNDIITASRTTDEDIWQLPLHEVYMKQIKGKVGDLKNSGGASASSITAGLYLRQFVNDNPWVHLDIAGTAFISDDMPLGEIERYWPKNGATGAIVRTLVKYAELKSK